MESRMFLAALISGLMLWIRLTPFLNLWNSQYMKLPVRVPYSTGSFYASVNKSASISFLLRYASFVVHFFTCSRTHDIWLSDTNDQWLSSDINVLGSFITNCMLRDPSILYCFFSSSIILFVGYYALLSWSIFFRQTFTREAELKKG